MVESGMAELRIRVGRTNISMKCYNNIHTVVVYYSNFPLYSKLAVFMNTAINIAKTSTVVILHNYNLHYNKQSICNSLSTNSLSHKVWDLSSV